MEAVEAVEAAAAAESATCNFLMTTNLANPGLRRKLVFRSSKAHDEKNEGKDI